MKNDLDVLLQFVIEMVRAEPGPLGQDKSEEVVRAAFGVVGDLLSDINRIATALEVQAGLQTIAGARDLG